MQFFHKKFVENLVNSKKSSTFALAFEKGTLLQCKSATFWVAYTVAVAQLVRASDCGSEGCGIVPHLPPPFRCCKSNDWQHFLCIVENELAGKIQ